MKEAAASIETAAFSFVPALAACAGACQRAYRGSVIRPRTIA